MTIDPHRGRCWWDGAADQRHANWLSLLDWSVYHAPGWELWQTFRESLKGQDMTLRANRISEWWREAISDRCPHGRNCECREVEEPQELADAVRVVNVLRSLRGQFSAHPELRALLAKLNPELSRRWNPKKA